jgi:hypothetical protein
LLVVLATGAVRRSGAEARFQSGKCVIRKEDVMATELWKQAYKHQYGTDPDDDMAEHAADIEEWRISWQAGYDAGEEWATSMVQEEENAENAESAG